MGRYWTSDLHLGHGNIIEYCPERQNLDGVSEVALGAPLKFDVDAMNASLIENWNEVVGPDDEVIIDGDLAMGKIDDSLALVPLLNGNKKLAPGNHDRCWPFAKNRTPERAAKMRQKYEDVGLEILPAQFETEIGGYTVLVCHFPYRGDSHDEDRYLFARPFDEGKILICGHVHDSWRVSGRQINVGVDVWGYRPIPDSELLRLIEEIES